MIRSIKKSKVLTFIEYSNHFGPLDLYCKDIHIIEDLNQETLVLSLHFLKQSYNGADFESFIDNIDWLKTISIRDDYTIERIVSFLKYGQRMSFKKKLEILAGTIRVTLDISFGKRGNDLKIVRLY